MAEEIKVFATDKLSFYERFSVQLLLISIAIIKCAFVIFLFPNNTVILFLTIVIIFLIVILSVLIYRSVNYIYEIQIDANKVRILGERYNEKWIEETEIQNLDISINVKHTKTGDHYYLVIKSNDKTFVVNKLFNWNYFILYKLYEEFKEAKSEKIMKDEKFLLNGIEKKAKHELQWRS